MALFPPRWNREESCSPAVLPHAKLLPALHPPRSGEALISGCLLSSPQHELTRFPFLFTKHCCPPSWDPSPDRDEEQQPATTAGHHGALHSSHLRWNTQFLWEQERAAMSKQLRNLSLLIAFSELLQVVLVCFCILCFKNSHFLDTSVEVL